MTKRKWLDRPVYVVEDIHADGTRTQLWPKSRSTATSQNRLALPATRWRGPRLMILMAWDGLLGRRGLATHCTICGEPLHRDGYCSPYPDPPPASAPPELRRGKPPSGSGVASKRADML